jgi:two-component system response regulator FlrC
MEKILIVDDQPCLQELFSDELMDEGYMVEGAVNAETAKECLRESMPDLVVLDLYLRGFEGWDILKDIKGKYPHLPVLIFTSYDSYKDHPTALLADGYVVKDFFAVERLKQQIADLLH